jgi:hypothetical protein
MPRGRPKQPTVFVRKTTNATEETIVNKVTIDEEGDIVVQGTYKDFDDRKPKNWKMSFSMCDVDYNDEDDD